MYRNIFKPFFDRLFSFIALVLSSPFFIVIAILLAIFQKGKVFFTQDRPGRNAKVFKLVKFKTMRDDTDEKGYLLPDEERLTWIGKLVRKTSLDELPQLLNVLMGQMSFVGPRPLLIEYLPRYTKEQSRRHQVMPGISGWAQVNGRNAISWDEKFNFDIWYVDNQSFLLDLKIIFRTVAKVFKAEGISAAGEATIKKFMGSDSEQDK